MSRAKRLLDEEPEEPAHGYWALQEALFALGKHDVDGAIALAKQAEEIGKRFGDRNLEVRGMQRHGAALIEKGDVAEGQLLIDEASTAAFGGELDPRSTLIVYCNTIGACRDVADYDRAGEWTDRANEFCESISASAFPGLCRVNRAEVMRFKGKLTEASEQAGQSGRGASPVVPADRRGCLLRARRDRACASASSRRPRRRFARLTSTGRIQSQAFRSSGSARATSRAPSPRSAARSATTRSGSRRESGSCPQPSRSRSPRTSWTRPRGMSTSSSRRPTRTTRPRSRPQEPLRGETSSSRAGTPPAPTAASGRPGRSGTPRERPTTSPARVRPSGTLRAWTETRSARSGSSRPPQLDSSASARCAMPNGLQISSR